jgi:molybdopterin-guanine dinucleotide biosynthesis protein A
VIVSDQGVDLKRAAVVLAGGLSKRYGRDKCLIELAGKPLVLHVVDRVCNLVDENVVVVSLNASKEGLSKMLKSKVKVVADKYEEHSPLIGALSGFESTDAEYSLLLPCDTPFVSTDITALLLDLCVSRAATIPRWPNGYIEPLQATYNTRLAIEASKKALNEGKRDLASMINNLHGVRYVSTLVLEQLDPQFLTFFNVNSPEALKKAESLLHETG